MSTLLLTSDQTSNLSAQVAMEQVSVTLYAGDAAFQHGHLRNEDVSSFQTIMLLLCRAEVHRRTRQTVFLHTTLLVAAWILVSHRHAKNIYGYLI